eukprot:Skav227529  [mRNA]  locus=scaffold2269:219192:219918:- [translate_table: standard]
MESASPENVHFHFHFHLPKPFHRRGANALDQFQFEGVRPHVVPNTASGKSFQGAVRYGHFYVVVDKIGSLRSSTDYPPFKAYAVEPWWLDNLLKGGKLSRPVYLTLAARCTIGFARRLQDCNAAERYEKERDLKEMPAWEFCLWPWIFGINVRT